MKAVVMAWMVCASITAIADNVTGPTVVMRVRGRDLTQRDVDAWFRSVYLTYCILPSGQLVRGEDRKLELLSGHVGQAADSTTILMNQGLGSEYIAVTVPDTKRLVDGQQLVMWCERLPESYRYVSVMGAPRQVVHYVRAAVRLVDVETFMSVIPGDSTFDHLMPVGQSNLPAFSDIRPSSPTVARPVRPRPRLRGPGEVR